MTFQRDEIAVVFNSSGILAENANFSTKNALAPVYTLNRNGVIKQSPHGNLESNFSISYIAEINDPILRHVNFLRTGRHFFHFDGQAVSIGGITGNCYLNTYNIKIEPNKIGKATASFTSYDPLTGYLQNKPVLNYVNLGGTGVLHGWTTYIPYVGGTNLRSYDFEYSANFNWGPLYIIGNPNPIQINLLGGSDSFSITKDYYTGVKFSGSMATGEWQLAGYQVILNEISSLANPTSYETFLLNMSGAQFNETRLEVGDDFVKVLGIAQNYF